MKNEIKELKLRMNRLEKELEVKMGELIDEFTTETGVSISTVYVERIDLTKLSDSTRKYAQGKVSVSIKL